MSPSRRLAWGGVVGPAAFVGAWAVLGARASAYSAVQQPISRLAAAGAPTRPAMTAALIAFGAGVSLYAIPAARAFNPGTALAAAATAAATIAVAALPLDGRYGDTPHAAAAGAAYVSLAAVPLLGARRLAKAGKTRAAWASRASAAAIAAALVASTLAPSGTGLLQRVGLTLGDAWIACSAAWILQVARAGWQAPKATPSSAALGDKLGARSPPESCTGPDDRPRGQDRGEHLDG